METASSASPAALRVSGSLDVITPSRAPVWARALSMTARSPPRWICGGSNRKRAMSSGGGGSDAAMVPDRCGKTLAMDVGDGRSRVEVVDLVSQKRRSSPVDVTSSTATAGNGTNGAASRAETGRSSRATVGVNPPRAGFEAGEGATGDHNTPRSGPGRRSGSRCREHPMPSSTTDISSLQLTSGHGLQPPTPRRRLSGGVASFVSLDRWT